jgi:hypothetical protein
MTNNKLIKLLASFDRKEMTRFKEFAHSPYHNKHEAVRELCTYLSQIYPRFDEDHCDRYIIFPVLFPKQKHNQKKLAVIFSYTMRLAETFLQHEQLVNSDHIQNRMQLQALRQKKLYPFFEKQLNHQEKLLNEEKIKSPDWYFQQYILATESNNLFNLTSALKSDDSLQKKQAYLDRYYLSETLRDACEMVVRSRILKQQYYSPLQEVIVQEVAKHFDYFGQDPMIAIYYRIYLMVSNDNTDYYYDALKTLDNMQEALSLEELKNIYNYLQNYCIKNINKGDSLFLKENFKLYQAQLAQGLLIENGYLSEWYYKNIVTTGLMLHELSWVYDFINDYQEMLSPETRENAYRFNLASYYYAAGQLGKVMQLLSRVEYSDVRYNLGAKVLLLRAYYDLKEYEPLYSLTDSFKQYLSRNKLLADVRRKGYRNLFKFTRRAANIDYHLPYIKKERSQKELIKLKSDMKKASEIFNKGWLEEKVAELERQLF